MSLTRAIISCYGAINPLVGLSSTALRLYGALEVFRDTYQSPMKDGWFRAPAYPSGKLRRDSQN
ncbi:hypothetical protein J4G02_10425 [Candidatus Poribacteria bacterium]|nr:hypothetical protein [Candidatus Poribacteria bacterium]